MAPVARVGLAGVALCVMVASAAGADNPSVSKSAPKDQRLCAPVEAATLCLDGGILRLKYWPVAFDGRMQTWMADGLFQGRLFMTRNDGDWCKFSLMLQDGAVCVLDSITTIVLTLADGNSVTSTEILSPDSPFDIRFWKASDGPLVFKNGECPYGRNLATRAYVLYVRFPEKSCLSDKIDGDYRRFKSEPVNMRIARRE